MGGTFFACKVRKIEVFTSDSLSNDVHLCNILTPIGLSMQRTILLAFMACSLLSVSAQTDSSLLAKESASIPPPTLKLTKKTLPTSDKGLISWIQIDPDQPDLIHLFISFKPEGMYPSSVRLKKIAHKGATLAINPDLVWRPIMAKEQRVLTFRRTGEEEVEFHISTFNPDFKSIARFKE